MGESITINGEWLSSRADWSLPSECLEGVVANLKRTKSVRKAITMAETAEAESQGDVTGVKISFEGKSEAELNEWLSDIQNRMEDIAGTLFDIGNEFKPKYEDLDRQVEDLIEDKVGP